MRNRLANNAAVAARRAGLAPPGPRRAPGRGLLAGIVALGLGASAAARAQSPGPAPQSPPGPAHEDGQTLQFKGARLGMTIAQWKALPYPGGASTHVETACVDSPNRSADPGARVVVCSYVTRYGRIELPQSFAFTATRLARDPSYAFVDGKLARIEFQTSIDAFDELDARFATLYGHGQDGQTLRDQHADVARVQKIWRTPGGTVRIIDPSPRPSLLSVQFTSAGLDRSSRS